MNEGNRLWRSRSGLLIDDGCVVKQLTATDKVMAVDRRRSSLGDVEGC